MVAPLTSHYRDLSFWHDTVPDDLTPRPALPGHIDVDVAIIGGGLTGLWTAWYLHQRDPSLSIAILESEIVGFGASGRNGGWCSALFPRSTASLEKAHGRDAALAMRRAMIATVDEVGSAAASIGLDIDYAKGGTVVYARSAAQLAAGRADVETARRYGVDALEMWMPDSQRPLGATGAVGAVFDPACARIHPAKLVRGLARALESRGVTIYEQTEVVGYSPGSAITRQGRVKCERLVVATEGYTSRLAATHRRMLPLYSLMIATEPLPDSAWDEIGLDHGQTFSDYRHLLVYGQRTADNRFAFGGRGARYHWGSAIRPAYDRVPAVFEHLRSTLGELFPSIGNVAVGHRWGGPIGAARDWHASVRFDPVSGIASAGGYVGDGLSTTNLAGRTLADLLTGMPSELTSLPWVNHHSPAWEPEPLRFLGANAGLAAMAAADVEERLTGRASLIARLMGPLVGH